VSSAILESLVSRALPARLALETAFALRRQSVEMEKLRLASSAKRLLTVQMDCLEHLRRAWLVAARTLAGQWAAAVMVMLTRQQVRSVKLTRTVPTLLAE
jgi:hypothetical protein